MSIICTILLLRCILILRTPNLISCHPRLWCFLYIPSMIQQRSRCIPRLIAVHTVIAILQPPIAVLHIKYSLTAGIPSLPVPLSSSL